MLMVRSCSRCGRVCPPDDGCRPCFAEMEREYAEMQEIFCALRSLGLPKWHADLVMEIHVMPKYMSRKGVHRAS